MVNIGCLARFFNRYEDEVAFAKANQFKLMQLWYDHRGLCLHPEDSDVIQTIKKHEFPTIIHAVLNINEFLEHVPKLLELLNEFEQKEIIIHPICENEVIDEKTLDKLDQSIKYALNVFEPNGITVYLENNSKLDPIFTTTDEIRKIFSQNETLEFLLDIAHIDDLNHLAQMVAVKMPKILHVADRHYNVVHEHLPLGQGEIEFETIFKQILPNFDGKIILEVVKDDEAIVNSKAFIMNLIK